MYIKKKVVYFLANLCIYDWYFFQLPAGNVLPVGYFKILKNIRASGLFM